MVIDRYYENIHEQICNEAPEKQTIMTDVQSKGLLDLVRKKISSCWHEFQYFVIDPFTHTYNPAKSIKLNRSFIVYPDFFKGQLRLLEREMGKE